MARRGRQSSGIEVLFAVMLGIAGVVWLVKKAAEYWPVTVCFAAAIVLSLLVWRSARAEAAERARQGAHEVYEAERRWWRSTQWEQGSFAVVFLAFANNGAESELATFLSDLPELRGQPRSRSGRCLSVSSTWLRSRSPKGSRRPTPCG